MTIQRATPPQSGMSVLRQVLSIFGVLSISSFFGWITFRYFAEWKANDVKDALLFKITLFYLVIVSLRTLVLLVMSFADRFFRHHAMESNSRWPLVSIIMPCYNEEDVLLKALSSMLAMEYPNFEVIVVDDGSSDQTLARAMEGKARGRVRVIHQPNQGKAQALNKGIEHAHGEFVLCVDADSVLAPDVLAIGMKHFARDPGIAAVAGNVAVGNDRNVITLFQKLEYVIGLNFHKSAQSFLSMVTIVPGPIGIFRKAAIQRIGGYHKGTFAEDCDLTLRLLMDGQRTICDLDMVAVTEGPEDYESLLKQRYRWSRGTLQAIKANARWLATPLKNPRNFSVMAYMLFESVVIPCVNFLTAIFFLQNTLSGRGQGLLGPFFMQLVLLDLVVAGYGLFNERQLPKLVMMALVNRMTYGLSMEIVRFCAIMDEVFGLSMTWNKLQRKGLSR